MHIVKAHDGDAARKLFRDALVASACVPGMFPPMIIHVSDGVHAYDELHVDGSVTTPLFITPLPPSSSASPAIPCGIVG